MRYEILDKATETPEGKIDVVLKITFGHVKILSSMSMTCLQLQYVMNMRI